MQMASSANRTCKLSRSGSECTATVLMPNSRQAQMTRQAISPRLAMRIFLNIARCRWLVASGWRLRSKATSYQPPATNRQPLFLDSKQGLAKFNRLAVLDKDFSNDAVGVGLNLVHQLHRFNDADHFIN